MSHSIMTEMTKKVLSDSFKKLLSTRPINKITVKDIVEDCKLTRQTFYYHFQDIYELLDWTYKNEILLNDSNSYDWKNKVTKFLFYIKENKAIFTALLLNQRDFENLVYPDLYQFNRKTLNILSDGINIPEKEKIFFANFITVSLIGLIIQWFNNGMKDNPENFIKILDDTLNTASLSIINKFRDSTTV